MVQIGDYSWVLFVVFGSLAALLACYGVAVLAISRVTRRKWTLKGARSAIGKGPDASPAAG